MNLSITIVTQHYPCTKLHLVSNEKKIVHEWLHCNIQQQKKGYFVEKHPLHTTVIDVATSILCFPATLKEHFSRGI